jgi:hypothetical protein
MPGGKPGAGAGESAAGGGLIYLSKESNPQMPA